MCKDYAPLFFRELRNRTRSILGAGLLLVNIPKERPIAGQALRLPGRLIVAGEVNHHFGVGPVNLVQQRQAKVLVHKPADPFTGV